MVKNLPDNAGDVGSIPGLGRYPGVGNGNPTPAFLPGKFHGQRSLAGYSPLGHKESDTTEKLSTHAWEAGSICDTGIRVSDLLYRLRITQGGNKILGKLLLYISFISSVKWRQLRGLSRSLCFFN